tara:strand:+ start:1183 stop:1626 length:444 start_codon:yes stop_codon:yes gene_type:complete
MFKAIDRKEILKVVSANDPAIDLEKSDLEAYQNGFDIKHLEFIEGELPTLFSIGTISFLKFAEIKDKHISFGLGDEGQQINTNLFGLTADMLRYSLKEVENLPFKIKIEKGRLSEGTMDRLAALNVIEELGNIALTVNGFGEDDKKK